MINKLKLSFLILFLLFLTQNSFLDENEFEFSWDLNSYLPLIARWRTEKITSNIETQIIPKPKFKIDPETGMQVPDDSETIELPSKSENVTEEIRDAIAVLTEAGENEFNIEFINIICVTKTKVGSKYYRSEVFYSKGSKPQTQIDVVIEGVKCTIDTENYKVDATEIEEDILKMVDKDNLKFQQPKLKTENQKIILSSNLISFFGADVDSGLPDKNINLETRWKKNDTIIFENKQFPIHLVLKVNSIKQSMDEDSVKIGGQGTVNNHILDNIIWNWKKTEDFEFVNFGSNYKVNKFYSGSGKSSLPGVNFLYKHSSSFSFSLSPQNFIQWNITKDTLPLKFNFKYDFKQKATLVKEVLVKEKVLDFYRGERIVTKKKNVNYISETKETRNFIANITKELGENKFEFEIDSISWHKQFDIYSVSLDYKKGKHPDVKITETKKIGDAELLANKKDIAEKYASYLQQLFASVEDDKSITGVIEFKSGSVNFRTKFASDLSELLDSFPHFYPVYLYLPDNAMKNSLWQETAGLSRNLEPFKFNMKVEKYETKENFTNVAISGNGTLKGEREIRGVKEKWNWSGKKSCELYNSGKSFKSYIRIDGTDEIPRYKETYSAEWVLSIYK